MDHPVGIKQGQLAVNFKHPLDHKHHICTTRIIFVKNNGYRILQCPGQDAFTEFGYLLAITQHNGVFADQVDTADMAVQIDPDTGPVQARCHLFDMGGFAGAVISLDHHPAVMAKPGQDSQRCIMIKLVGLVDGGHII